MPTKMKDDKVLKIVCPICQHATLTYPKGYFPRLDDILHEKTDEDFSTFSYSTTSAMCAGYNQAIKEIKTHLQKLIVG